MSVKDKYTVRSIPAEETKEWLLYKHYAKRLPCIEYSFGLFSDVLNGVATFGTPVSSNLRNAFGDTFKMIELNRLCVNDGLDKNILSFFVSKALLLLPVPLIVVSYADTDHGHHGYIYQATNWIYTGLSAKRTDWKIKGLEHLHGATIADISRGKENRAQYMRDVYGDNFYLEERSRKHRYFYFIGTKKDKKRMRELLPYAICEYPKGDNQRYDASYKPTIQTSLF